MNVLILAYTIETYATQQIARHFRERRHQVSIASPLECSLEVSSEFSTVAHKGEHLSAIDVVLLRGLRYIHNGVPVPRALETSIASAFLRTGALCFNSPESHVVAADKLATFQRLTKLCLPVPTSFLTCMSSDLDRIANRIGLPLILKTLDGTWGIGVVRCDSLESARSTFDALQSTGQSFIVQQYVPHSRGEDVRVLVVGNRVLGAMRLFPLPGDFRSNIKQGARAEAVDLSPDHEKVAISAASALDIDIAGVDLIESPGGPLVLEVNSVPGLEKIDTLCSIDSALAIVQYIEACHAQRLGSATKPL